MTLCPATPSHVTLLCLAHCECVAGCCNALQGVAVCCSMLAARIIANGSTNERCCSMLQRVAVCCSVLQNVAACCSVLQRVAVCSSGSMKGCLIYDRVPRNCPWSPWQKFSKSQFAPRITQYNNYRRDFLGIRSRAEKLPLDLLLLEHATTSLHGIVECVAVCCSVLQCVAVCCGVLWCVAVCCSVLRCGVVCCSVLQCVAVWCSVL